MNLWQQLWTSVHFFLGLGADPKNLTFVQISVRGVIVMISALMMIRMGSKRSLAEKTVFDVVLMVILASALARPINGNAPFFRPWVADLSWSLSIDCSPG